MNEITTTYYKIKSDLLDHSLGVINHEVGFQLLLSLSIPKSLTAKLIK